MSLKDRITAFENDAKILERIASQYDETSTEHAALKHAAIALWSVSTSNYEAFKDYVTKFEGDFEARTAIPSDGNGNRPRS